MTPSDTSFVDPSSLSLPSPSSDATAAVITVPTDHTAGPSRKRPRSEVSAEERKDARAHRNRIAAQNSRDRRKAQFAYLERRVAELEEENRQLRAGMGLSEVSRLEESKCQEREKARDKENEELRERVKTLEQGWDAVVKALTAQGLPTGLPFMKPTTSESTSQSAHESTPPPSDPQSFPVLTPSTNDFPTPTTPSLPNSVGFHSPPSTGGDHRGHPSLDVPAAGGIDATQICPEFTSWPQSTSSTNERTEVDDEAAMQDLFREILVSSPALPTSALPMDSPTLLQFSTASTPSSLADTDWDSEVEMQRLLDLLPHVQSVGMTNFLNVDTVDFPSALELELNGGWSLENSMLPSSGIGVF